MTDRTGRTDAGSLTIIAGGVVALVVAVAVPGLRPTLLLAANLLAVVAVGVAVIRRRPARASAWTLIGGGLTLTLAGHTVDVLGPERRRPQPG